MPFPMRKRHRLRGTFSLFRWLLAMVVRTTVTFEDSDGELLQAWADYDVRPLASLVSAIVVATLRGRPLKVPEEVKSIPETSPSKLVLMKLATGKRPNDKEIDSAARDLGIDKEQLVTLLRQIID